MTVRNVRKRPNRTNRTGVRPSELSGGYIPRTFRTPGRTTLALYWVKP
jgi:hypothetical protein